MKTLRLIALFVLCACPLWAQSNVQRLAYVNSGAGWNPWAATLSGGSPPSGSLPGVLLYCQSGASPSTIAPCNPISGAQPHMTFGGSSGTTFVGINTEYGATYTPTLAITLTGFDIHLDTAGSGCSTWAVVSVYDETAGAPVSGMAITLSATADFHITASVAIPATHRLAFATTTAGVGCTTNPTSPHFVVEYVMQ